MKHMIFYIYMQDPVSSIMCISIAQLILFSRKTNSKRKHKQLQCQQWQTISINQQHLELVIYFRILTSQRFQGTLPSSPPRTALLWHHLIHVIALKFGKLKQLLYTVSASPAFPLLKWGSSFHPVIFFKLCISECLFIFSFSA